MKEWEWRLPSSKGRRRSKLIGDLDWYLNEAGPQFDVKGIDYKSLGVGSGTGGGVGVSQSLQRQYNKYATMRKAWMDLSPKCRMVLVAAFQDTEPVPDRAVRQWLGNDAYSALQRTRTHGKLSHVAFQARLSGTNDSVVHAATAMVEGALGMLDILLYGVSV